MQFPFVNEPRTMVALALGFAVLTAGCPSNDTTDDVAGDTGTGTTDDEVGDTTTTTESGTDSGTESSTDSGTESSTTDTGTESSTTDTGTETTATDTGTDTTATDTGTDTTTDTGTTTDEGPETIYAIQDGTVASDTPVEVLGVWVTGVRANGFFAQEVPGGQFSGIFVYVGNMGPDIAGLAIGDLVDITGEATEFGGLTEIDASMGTVMETGTIAPPAPDLIMSADLDPGVAEPWESVYVRVEGDLEVSGLPGMNEFEVTDADGTAIVDNYFYDLIADGAVDFPLFGVGATFTAIQGIVNFNTNLFKLAPRSAGDLEGYMQSANPVSGVDDLSPGDLVITEIMYDPNKNACTEPGCEWIEVYNATANPVDLDGLRIQDSQLNMAAQGTISVSLIVPPGGYVWLGHSAMNWPYNMQADAYMGNNPSFNNSGSDSAAILNSMVILDQTALYASQGATDNGVSWKLKGPGTPSAAANDMAGNWCWSTTVYDVDLGSPKAANEAGCNPNLP
ncbi:lamin tail domain-containing protein [Nannocystaceae bacterium ST9]